MANMRSSSWEKTVGRIKNFLIPKAKLESAIAAPFLRLGEFLSNGNGHALIEFDRTSDGIPSKSARRKLNRGLEHLHGGRVRRTKTISQVQASMSIQQDNDLLRLPVEILQKIAWEYLPWSSEAALALTCHQMRDTIGTRSWGFHDTKHPACMECEPFDKNGHNEDIHEDFYWSKDRFLDLLARDLPRGSAFVCLKHEIIHHRASGSIQNSLRTSCDDKYRLPMGLKWGPRCSEIQLAVLGVMPAERLSYYQKCRLAGGLPADVAVYGKVVEDRFILAMQYRVWIPAYSHLGGSTVKGGSSECVRCYKGHLENLYWLGDGGSSRGTLCLPMYSKNPINWHNKLLTVRQPHRFESRYVAQTTVRVEYEHGQGVRLLFDVFCDLGRGYRAQDVLGRSPQLVATPPPMGMCDCKACRKRRDLERVFLEHFQDHQQRVEALRPEKPSSIRGASDGCRSGLRGGEQWWSHSDGHTFGTLS